MVCNSAGLIDHPPLFGSVEHSNSDVPETPNAVISLLFSSYKEDEDSSESEEQEAMGQQHPSSSTLLISALTASGINKNDGESVVLDWDWLSRNVFKANENVPTVQAGLLLAAGLTGHIRSINLYDVHTFLSKNDRFVSIALLIGCAVAFKGTADVHVYFMFFYILCRIFANISHKNYFSILGKQFLQLFHDFLTLFLPFEIQIFPTINLPKKV